MFEENKSDRTKHKNLPAQLRTNGTSCSGNKYRLPCDATLQQLRLRWDRVTSEQVGNIYLLNIVYFDSPTRQIHKTRNTAYMNGKTLKEVQNFTSTTTS
ncbi:hypothetical protein D3C78_835480 [compost metagenome]